MPWRAKVRLLDDFFRLVHCVDDRRVDTYRAIAGLLSQRPLT